MFYYTKNYFNGETFGTLLFLLSKFTNKISFFLTSTLKKTLRTASLEPLDHFLVLDNIILYICQNYWEKVQLKIKVYQKYTLDNLKTFQHFILNFLLLVLSFIGKFTVYLRGILLVHFLSPPPNKRLSQGSEPISLLSQSLGGLL